MVGSNLKGTQLQQIVDKTMRSVDCDQDGKISFEEFCQIVGKTDFDKKLQDVTVWREDKLFTLHILKLKSNINFIELAYSIVYGSYTTVFPIVRLFWCQQFCQLDTYPSIAKDVM